MPDYSHLPFRPCVGVCLLNEDGHVFVGERIDTPDAWQMPQGGIDPGEDLEKAAYRELYEETGIANADILKITNEPLRYTMPDHLIETLWGGCTFQGQEQHWIAMRFTGNEAEVNLRVHEPPEFNAWQWIPLQETLRYVVPFKHDLYTQVIAQFSHLTD